MSRIHVCSLARIEDTITRTGARSLVTLINVDTPVPRPSGIAPEGHLFVGISDITDPMDGHIHPQERHVAELLEFVRRWDRSAPMLIHCYAGVSRSTAAAFITACALEPERSEAEFAAAIRTASPTATPNARLVAVADAMLGRQGRMVEAVERMGRGDDCYEGVPFMLDLARVDAPRHLERLA